MYNTPRILLFTNDREFVFISDKRFVGMFFIFVIRIFVLICIFVGAELDIYPQFCRVFPTFIHNLPLRVYNNPPIYICQHLVKTRACPAYNALQ